MQDTDNEVLLSLLHEACRVDANCMHASRSHSSKWLDLILSHDEAGTSDCIRPHSNWWEVSQKCNMLENAFSWAHLVRTALLSLGQTCLKAMALFSRNVFGSLANIQQSQKKKRFQLQTVFRHIILTRSPCLQIFATCKEMPAVWLRNMQPVEERERERELRCAEAVSSSSAATGCYVRHRRRTRSPWKLAPILSKSHR